MIKARIASDRLRSLQSEGRIGTNTPMHVEEAMTVGASWALDPAHDWVLPQHREPIGLGRYGPEVLNRYVAWAIGHPAGAHIPEPIRVFPPQMSLSTQILQGVGLAWALKMRNEPGVTLTFFGAGTGHESDFYEAAKLAAVHNAPAIFLCSVTDSEMSTLADQQSASPIAAQAHALRIPGVVVDGNAALAVLEVVATARDRALAGNGPTLIVARNLRLDPRSSTNAASRHSSHDHLADRDPLVTFRRQLENRGIWDREMQADAERTAKRAIDHAWVWASNLPLQQSDLFDHVFASPNQRQRQQRTDLEQLLRSDR